MAESLEHHARHNREAFRRLTNKAEGELKEYMQSILRETEPAEQPATAD